MCTFSYGKVWMEDETFIEENDGLWFGSKMTVQQYIHVCILPTKTHHTKHVLTIIYLDVKIFHFECYINCNVQLSANWYFLKLKNCIEKYWKVLKSRTFIFLHYVKWDHILVRPVGMVQFQHCGVTFSFIIEMVVDGECLFHCTVFRDCMISVIVVLTESVLWIAIAIVIWIIWQVQDSDMTKRTRAHRKSKKWLPNSSIC